ncbi:MAG: M1 family peptidase, partial [Deltaproteobacteria bacterium]|nr:M1 family peptidase [Deltaproteobacteria bacterium]
MARPDPHSYADDMHPGTRHIDLVLDVDFAARRLAGTATLHLDDTRGGPLHLDTRALEILSATDGNGAPVPFSLDPPDAVLGARLKLDLPAGMNRVTLRYRTSPDASALQWLDPAQTAGGKHPYLFSQCQSIHARSMVPCQDSPRLRVTYKAELNVPAPLVAVMAAAPRGTRPLPDGRTAYLFEMPQPIPSYLFALAVGELQGRDLSPRSRVYAEPALLDTAAHEFGGVEAMITAAEKMFGPYPWERFDMLVMPPSFPFGGMENPRLTFLTPTLLAGDRSLVNVVIHELAHSWTGNLVTNATLEHFWLNEGFTVYAERRILEAMEGAEAVAMHAAIGLSGLKEDMARLEGRFTRLQTHLEGVDPDEVYSQVPYEKGCLLLQRIEVATGREAFDRFLRTYIS